MVGVGGRRSENVHPARSGGGIDYWPSFENNNYADPNASNSDIINISAIKQPLEFENERKEPTELLEQMENKSILACSSDRYKSCKIISKRRTSKNLKF
jgi:hypothetical protein